MPGARQKAPTALQNTRGGRGRGVSVPGRPPGWRMPTLPAEVTSPLLDPVQARYQSAAVKHAREVWRRWWESAPSLAVDVNSDMEAITWWIICVFRRSLYIQIVREQPLVKGSMGQPVGNPLEAVIRDLTRDINRTSDRFGQDTLARFRLSFEARRDDRDDEDATAMEAYRAILEGA